MSEIVSRRPSSRNQRKDAFWMSIRLGRSRTCFRREKLLRARGAATPLLNYEASLGNGLRMCGRTSTAGTDQLTEIGHACARATHPLRRSSGSIAEARRLPLVFSAAKCENRLAAGDIHAQEHSLRHGR